LYYEFISMLSVCGTQIHSIKKQTWNCW
jgi:hypothetical protein